MKKTLLFVLLAAVAVFALTITTVTTPAASAAPKCPNGPEYDYVSRDTQECLTITFFCPPGSEQFYNECGCGCVEL